MSLSVILKIFENIFRANAETFNALLVFKANFKRI
jgi:hypothetical protein